MGWWGNKQRVELAVRRSCFYMSCTHCCLQPITETTWYSHFLIQKTHKLTQRCEKQNMGNWNENRDKIQYYLCGFPCLLKQIAKSSAHSDLKISIWIIKAREQIMTHWIILKWDNLAECQYWFAGPDTINETSPVLH